MKDLTHIYNDEKFKATAKKFEEKHQKENRCDKTKNDTVANKWKVFKSDFLRLSHHKCPICEREIDNFSDIDHYRPKKHYDFLKCNYRNFIILCKVCNSSCKGEDFPLHTEFKAESIADIQREQPLLINPCNDDIYHYFCIEFRQSRGEKILMLTPHFDLDKDSYDYKRAETTIAFYGLGDCVIGQNMKRCRDNHEVDICRRDFMQRMYGTFFDFIEYLDDFSHNKITKDELMKKAIVKKNLNYGFYEFIKRKQFKINII